MTSSTEHHLQTSRIENRHKYVENGPNVMKDFVKRNGLSVTGSQKQPSFSSDSPFSSDSDVEHTYERRNSYKENIQAISAKELKKIQTERILEPREKSVNSTNQRTRLSWHGFNKVGKIPTPQKPAHDSLGSNSRSPERQAQVTWGDLRIQRRFTIGSGVIGNNKTIEQVVPRQTESIYKVTISKSEDTFLHGIYFMTECIR